MEEANPNNYIPQILPNQKHCSKKKFIVPLFIIRAVALILCIIQYIYQVTNLEIYAEFEAQNNCIDSNELFNSYNSNNYINEILNLKKEENEMANLNLIPTIISFILAGFLFLHFWFEEECCCGQKKSCLAECHIILNSLFNVLVGFIGIVGSLLDCFSTRSTIDKYSIYFMDSDFQKRNQINKIIDIFLFLIVLITYILLIIVLCYVNRENNMCNMHCRFKCCDCCVLCEIDCCHLCSCCDIPDTNVSSNNSLNNQQQNIIVVQQCGNPMNNNSNNADNTVYSAHDLKNTKLNNYQTNQQMPSSNDKIHAGKKKLTNNKKKKIGTKNKGCIKDKYNKDYKNISECTICNTNFKNGENILILPCGHIFHHNCANNWFKSNNNICPIDGTQTN